MKFTKFSAAHEAAKAQLRSFEGNDNWPGLTEHDRAYTLPGDWQNEEYTAIVRVHMLDEHESCLIPVSIWHWHWRGGQAGKLSKLSFQQLAAVAEIKRIVRSWIDGEIAELPPSTCRHLSQHISAEEPR